VGRAGVNGDPMPILKNKNFLCCPLFFRHLLFSLYSHRHLHSPSIIWAFTIFSAIQRARWANANANKLINNADAGADQLLMGGLGNVSRR
jgi:hypothetical protein